MDSRQHRIWAHTALAWLAMVAIPTLFVTIQWQRGIARDVDIRSVWELIVTFLIVLTLPMGALAFGVYGPLAIGIDRRTAGRTTGVANALIGAALAVPALVVALVALIATDWRSIAEYGLRASLFGSTRNLQSLVLFSFVFITAGIIVGLGLRRPGTTGRGSS